MRTDSALGPRIVSALLFLPLLAWVIHAGGIWYSLYCALLLLFALEEFYRLGSEPLPAGPCALGGAALLLELARGARVAAAAAGTPLAPGLMPGWPWPGPAAAALALAVVALLGDLLFGRVEGSLKRVGRLLLGYIYIGGLGSYLLLLRFPPLRLGSAGAAAGALDGVAAVALAYLLTWSGDTAAYGAGLLWGRRSLHPRVSPRKTWEGALGGVAASVAVGALAGSAAPWIWLGPGRGALLGLLVGVAGQLGDLIESMLKRDLHSKDSAQWIPGHGGVLDRFDSLLLAGPVVYHFLSWSALR